LSSIASSVGIERVGADAAVGRGVLVLLADRLAEHVDLDVRGVLGQAAGRRGHPLGERERLDQPHGVGAARAEAGASRNVGQRGDLQRVAFPVTDQRLAQDWVLDVLDPVDLLELRVLHPVAALEDRVGQEVHVLVDRAGHQEAAPLGVVGRDVGPAPAQGDAQRRSCGDDAHALACS
jgi:hypothetical protein